MSHRVRSARGEIVDFDLLSIKQQLAVTPVPVSVDQRRRFIDEKDGIKTKSAQPISDALLEGLEAAKQSADAAADITEE